MSYQFKHLLLHFRRRRIAYVCMILYSISKQLALSIFSWIISFKIKIPSRHRGTLTLRRLVLNTCACIFAMGGRTSSIRNLFPQLGTFITNTRNFSRTHHLDDNTKRIITVNDGPQSTQFITNHISTSKYSILSFLPKFLFEQFRKYANIFFLCIAVLQQIPGVSPTGRYTTAVPLSIILCCAAIKEIIEDVKRHFQDDAVNNRKVLIYRRGNWLYKAWRKVKVGDIVKVLDKEFFPADLILLSSGEPHSICYIQTSNLDGETNLKVRQGLPQTADMISSNQLKELKGVIECELPNRNLYEFAGTFRLQNVPFPIPLGSDQILLRGSQLKNTEWVYGLVIYTGHESKLMMNSSSVPFKRTHVEQVTNSQILFLLALLIVLCLFSTIAGEIWNYQNKINHWYLGLTRLTQDKTTNSVPNHFGYTFLTFFILYNNLIPISLQITVDLVKFIQAYFINWDRDMYDPETDTPANARTSNLNEELGQVKYIFSDKTGTLTKNVMIFKQCSIGGIMYGSGNIAEFNSYELLKNLEQHKTGVQIREFLTLLATCHTVVPENKMHTASLDDIAYQASSPDEYALVSALKEMGVVFFLRTPASVVINFRGEEEKYEILNVLEFSSDRKRMSVIVRTPKNEIKLYCKGADSVIMERLVENDGNVPLTMEHLESFAKDGLRTLCLSYRVLSNEEYNEWLVQYREASTTINNRNELVAEVAERIERNLILLGATGIEDKLQDQVPESLSMLLKAGIKVWILTGDKKETAINIGFSCKLLSDQLLNLTLDGDTLDDTQRQLYEHCQKFGESLRKENLASLVIEGKTLKYALSPTCRQDFLDLAISCKTVICCRVSPKQKAEVVELIKRTNGDITLAIGDGANDVGMIQTAHVGVGIMGREGVQAACASDYTIGQFRFLTKLLFVHGVWNYRRLCKVLLYSFYKNICLYVMELWFAFHNGFSGQILFERWTIAIYNVLFTAAPPMALGLLDRCCSAETMMRFPAIYKMSQNRSDFNIKVFWTWCLNAVYHSIILYFMSYAMLRHGMFEFRISCVEKIPRERNLFRHCSS
jgi:phospholipid-transporting ATPase